MKRSSVTELHDSLSPDFLDFIAALNEREVEFVLVGGYAVGVHGIVRATGDIDFLYRRTEANVRRLCEAMEDFGAPRNVIDFDTLMTPDTVTMFGRAPYRIDLLSDITGVAFAQVWQGSAMMEIQGQPLRVIGIVELRANKAATGRKKDENDLRKLASATARGTTRRAASGTEPAEPTPGRAPRPTPSKRTAASGRKRPRPD